MSAGAGHAVVVGGSVAGLLAARVLAERWPRVTVCERDPEPAAAVPRKGAPQGHQTHALLLSGVRLFEELFPGLGAELEAGGAVPVDFAGDLAHFHFGSWKLRHDSGMRGFIQTRPFFEQTLRRRLDGHPAIRWRYRTPVSGLETTADRRRVRAVVLGSGGSSTARQELAAELVVDASGRGSRLPAWLHRLGLPAPPERRVRLGLGHSSRLFRRRGGFETPWKSLLIYPRAPAERRAGLLFPVEGGRWLVSLAGYMGDHPPRDAAGFAEFAASLPRPDLHRVIAGLEPVSQIVTHRFGEQVRRRWEAVPGLPAGLIALGDAACCLDPLFGQGMSLAAAGAELLGRCLDEAAGAAAYDRLSARFHRRLARVIDVPWLLTTSEAFRYPGAAGDRPPGLAALQWYSARLFELSATDREAYRAFLEVMHLVSGLNRAFRPRLAWRVVGHGLATAGGKHGRRIGPRGGSGPPSSPEGRARPVGYTPRDVES